MTTTTEPELVRFEWSKRQRELLTMGCTVVHSVATTLLVERVEGEQVFTRNGGRLHLDLCNPKTMKPPTLAFIRKLAIELIGDSEVKEDPGPLGTKISMAFFERDGLTLISEHVFYGDRDTRTRRAVEFLRCY